MKLMRIWRANHQDGSLRKIWAAVVENGKLLTRWAAAGKNLCKEEAIDLKGASASAKLAEMERNKRNGASRYEYLGEFPVSEDGVIDWDGKPVSPAKPTAAKFYSLHSAKLQTEMVEALQKAGFAWDRISKNEAVFAMPDEDHLKFRVEENLVSCAVKAQDMTAAKVLIMAYLAKQGEGDMTDPSGNLIKPTFDALSGHFGTDTMRPMREAAETLGIAAKPLSRLLKQSSGLFNWS